MAAFLAAHPEAARALDLLARRTVSSGFGNDTYNSLNAFLLVDANGKRQTVRWSAAPAKTFMAADPAPRGGGDDNFLFDALLAEERAHALRWQLVFALSQAGDPTNDATLAWPADRRRFEAGTITIDRAAGEDVGVCTDVNYDPLVLPTGIEPSDDPLLAARLAVYARSFTLRSARCRGE